MNQIHWKKAGFGCAFLAAGVLLGFGAFQISAKYMMRMPSAAMQAETEAYCLVTEPRETDADHPYFSFDGSLELVVQNHDGLNTSDREILYTVDLYAVGSDGSLVDQSRHQTGTLNESTLQKTHVMNGLRDGLYLVRVESSVPYETTIDLYFEVMTQYADSYYRVTAHTGWLELEVFTGQSSDPISVQYTNLQPDTLNDEMKQWTASESGTSKTGVLSDLSEYSHSLLIFFGTYTGEDQLVLEQSGRQLAQKDVGT